MDSKLTTLIGSCSRKSTFNYSVFVREVEKLNPDLTVMIEHLSTQEEYIEAFEYIEGVARKNSVSLR